MAVWSGPLIGGHRTGDRQLSVSTIRSRIDLAGLALRHPDQVVSLCIAISGPTSSAAGHSIA